LKNKLDFPLLKERLEPCENDNPDSDLIARTCVTCDNRVFIGKDQWDIHIKSARHRRMVKRRNNPKKIQEVNPQPSESDPKADKDQQNDLVSIASSTINSGL
jgi:hypothetical protein